jgi:hypothetical protein
MRSSTPPDGGARTSVLRGVATSLAVVTASLLLSFGCGSEESAPTQGDKLEEEFPLLDDQVTADATDVSDVKGISKEEEEGLLALGYIASEPIAERSGVTQHDSDSAQQGWNLYTTMAGQEAWLMDMDGKMIHRWALSLERAGPYPLWWRTVHLFSNGDLVAQGNYGPIARLDWNSKVIWEYKGRTHHDFDVRDDGHIFVLTNETNEIPGFTGKIQDDFVVELSPEGQELRKVSVVKALREGGRQDIVRELIQYQKKVAITQSDPLHTNTLEILDGRHAQKEPAFKHGNILISLPHVGRIAVMDFDAGQIVWSLKGSFRTQHDPTLLANGNILLFDNKGLEGKRSRVLEINPLTGEEVWSFGSEESPSFYSKCCGRAYRLENDNTLVIVTNSGQAIEVTPQGRKVWQFTSAHTFNGKMANLHDVLRLPVDPSLLEKNAR